MNEIGLDLDFMSSVLNAFDHAGPDLTVGVQSTTQHAALLSPEGSAQDLFSSALDVHDHHATESVATSGPIKPIESAVSKIVETPAAKQPVEEPKAAAMETKKPAQKVDELTMALQALKNMPLSPTYFFLAFIVLYSCVDVYGMKVVGLHHRPRLKRSNVLLPSSFSQSHSFKKRKSQRYSLSSKKR